MALEVLPNKITIYPQDRREFTAQGIPGPALWYNLVNGTVQADRSVLLTAPALLGEAESAQALIAVPGFCEWMLTSDCVPTGNFPTGGFLEIVVVCEDGSEYGVLIYGDKRAVGAGPLSPAQNYTPAAGHRYRIALDGQRHLFVNGELIHETQPPFSGPGAPTCLPVWIRMRLQGPVVSGNPRMPVVALAGDWQLKEDSVVWTPPGDGQLTATTGVRTEFFDGDTPGEWTLRAEVGGQANQRFDAIVSIPPLARIGAAAVTLQPGQKARFKVNYDLAQNDVVAWEVVSGAGNFDAAHVYTAPSAPGVSVIRASYGGQQVDFTITVPAVITPAIVAVEPGELVDFDTNIPGATWSVDGGSINSGNGFWQAPSTIGQVIRVTADNGSISTFKDVVVLQKFPESVARKLAAPIQWQRRKTVIVSDAEDRSRASRVKDKSGLPYEPYELRFKLLTPKELDELHAFWDSHHPGVRFIFEDPLRQVRKVVRFESDLSHEGVSRRSFDCSVRIKEA